MRGPGRSRLTRRTLVGFYSSQNKVWGALRLKNMSIPTGHFIIRRFSRPISKSAQPKGRWHPARYSNRCCRCGCASMAAKYARGLRARPRIFSGATERAPTQGGGERARLHSIAHASLTRVPPPPRLFV